MFENILHAPLQLPSGASRAAQSLLAGLLDREVSSRLGEKRDFVSACNKKNKGVAVININSVVSSGGNPGTSLLCFH